MTLEAGQDNALPERLVRAADAERQRLERDLHEGVQQLLVALAVNLQLAESLLHSDPVAAKTLLEELRGDVQQALGEAAQLAQRIYPQLLEQGGLAATLRAAAASAGTPASVDVSAGSKYPPEAVYTIYSCWLQTLEHASAERAVSITVREEAGAVTFAIDGYAGSADEHLRDRVQALGGRLTFEPLRLLGTLPLSR